jgi:hypothetical protein
MAEGGTQQKGGRWQGDGRRGRGKMAEGGSIADRALELQLVCRIELAGEREGHGIGGREKEDSRGETRGRF